MSRTCRLMPAPGYQRDAGWAELSARTASTLEACGRNFKWPVKPARCRLGGIVGAHCEHIGGLRAELQMARQFVPETHVPVRPLSEMNTVDPDFAVGHHAIELDEDAL